MLRKYSFHPRMHHSWILQWGMGVLWWMDTNIDTNIVNIDTNISNIDTNIAKHIACNFGLGCSLGAISSPGTGSCMSLRHIWSMSLSIASLTSFIFFNTKFKIGQIIKYLCSIYLLRFLTIHIWFQKVRLRENERRPKLLFSSKLYSPAPKSQLIAMEV